MSKQSHSLFSRSCLFSLFSHCLSHSKFPSDAWAVCWLMFKSGNCLKIQKLIGKRAPGCDSLTRTSLLAGWAFLGGTPAVHVFGGFPLGMCGSPRKGSLSPQRDRQHPEAGGVWSSAFGIHAFYRRFLSPWMSGISQSRSP